MSAAATGNIGDEEVQHIAYAAALSSSVVLPMALNTAVELNLFEIIANAGPDARLSPSEIAARLQTHQPEAPDMLDRIMHLLASHAILTCSSAGDADGKTTMKERLYGLAPVAKYFFPNADGVSYGPLLRLVQQTAFIHSWYKLKDAIIVGGVPFDMAHGMPAFDYFGKHPEMNHIFNTAMYNLTTMQTNQLLESYKGFENLKNQCLVDVGGGLGVTLNIITSRYPTIKGINFDLPHVIQHAPAYPGIKNVGGDMFEHIPEGDAIFMRVVLHNWSDEHSLKILRNCYKSLPETGKVIVVDCLLPEIPDTSNVSKIISGLNALMMTQYIGGKERTKQEFKDLALKAGFSRITFEPPVATGMSVMEFFKLPE